MCDPFKAEEKFILACLQKQTDLPAIENEARLLDRMRYHQVTFSVFEHLQRLGGDRLSKSAMVGLKEAYQLNICRNLAIVHLLKKLNHSLERNNIPFLVLKGGLFLSEFPHYSSVRELRDLDILVQPQHLMQASQTLGQVGFALQEDTNFILSFLQGVYRRYFNNAITLQTESPSFRDIPVELHWQLFSPAYNYTRWSALEIWSRSTSYSTLNVHSLDVMDTLLHLCAHLCNDAKIFLYSLLDVVNVLTYWESEIVWEDLIRRASAQGILFHLINVLRLSHELLGQALPDVYEAHLKPYEKQAEPGYQLIIDGFSQQDFSTGNVLAAERFEAFRSLEGFSIWRYIRYLAPRSLRQKLVLYFDELTAS